MCYFNFAHSCVLLVSGIALWYKCVHTLRRWMPRTSPKPNHLVNSTVQKQEILIWAPQSIFCFIFFSVWSLLTKKGRPLNHVHHLGPERVQIRNTLECVMQGRWHQSASECLLSSPQHQMFSAQHSFSTSQPTWHRNIPSNLRLHQDLWLWFDPMYILIVFIYRLMTDIDT